MLALNLLPWREQSRKNAIRRLQGLLLGVGLLAALIVWVADQLGRQVQQRQIREHASLHQAIEHLDAQLAQIAQHKLEQEQVEQRLQALEHLQGKRLLLVELLENLANAVPQGVYLTEVTRQDRHLQIHGLARSGSLLAHLLRNLSAALGEAEMQQMKAVDKGEAFELSVTLKGAS